MIYAYSSCCSSPSDFSLACKIVVLDLSLSFFLLGIWVTASPWAFLSSGISSLNCLPLLPLLPDRGPLQFLVIRPFPFYTLLLRHLILSHIHVAPDLTLKPRPIFISTIPTGRYWKYLRCVQSQIHRLACSCSSLAYFPDQVRQALSVRHKSFDYFHSSHCILGRGLVLLFPQYLSCCCHPCLASFHLAPGLWQWASISSCFISPSPFTTIKHSQLYLSKACACFFKALPIILLNMHYPPNYLKIQSPSSSDPKLLPQYSPKYILFIHFPN